MLCEVGKNVHFYLLDSSEAMVEIKPCPTPPKPEMYILGEVVLQKVGPPKTDISVFGKSLWVKPFF